MTIQVLSTTLGDFLLDSKVDGPLMWALPLEFGKAYDLRVNKSDRLNAYAFTIYGLRILVSSHHSVEGLADALADEEAGHKATEDEVATFFELLFHEKILTDSTIMPQLIERWRAVGINEGHRRHGVALSQLMQGIPLTEGAPNK